MHLHPFRTGQGIPQLKERDVRVLRHKLFKESSMRSQFPSIKGATLRCGSRVPFGLDCLTSAPLVQFRLIA